MMLPSPLPGWHLSSHLDRGNSNRFGGYVASRENKRKGRFCLKGHLRDSPCWMMDQSDDRRIKIDVGDVDAFVFLLIRRFAHFLF